MLCLVAVVVLIAAPLAEAAGLYRIDAMKSKHEYLHAGLQKRGWRRNKRVTSSIWGFLWSFRHVVTSSPGQYTNHYANFDVLTSKSGLLEQLKAAGDQVASFFPRCHLWPRDAQLVAMDYHRTLAACSGVAVDPDAEAVLHRLQPDMDCSPDSARPGSVWIVKPAFGARGVGIKVFDELRLMELFLQQQEQAHVVQKYIERPLLLFGRKFDIRVFVLITALQPLTVFCSDDAYVRLSSVDYNASSLSDPFVHLTNAQVQKLAPADATREAADADRGIEQNQWPLRRLRAHLPEGAWDDHVLPRLRSLVAQTMRAWPERNTAHRDRSFELLGLDIMLSETLQPYLLEVNGDPGMHVLSSVVAEHHERAMEGLLNVVLDRRDDWIQHPACSPEQPCHPGVHIDPWTLILKE